jgi:hypothetical protein
MSTIEQIEAAILTLPPEQFQRLRQWILDVSISSIITLSNVEKLTYSAIAKSYLVKVTSNLTVAV